MNLIFMGPQGSGKGTQAKIIADMLKIPHVSTGDLLRNAEGEIKKEADFYVNKGKLVPDSLMLRIIRDRLSRQDCKNGFILDGYPRNLSQAKLLDSMVKIDLIIEISISDEESLRRLGGRVSCKKCGATYNEVTNPPKQKGKCDKCSSILFKRDDDNREIITERLRIYHEETEPILKHYRSIRINGEQPIERVTADILRRIKPR